MKRVFVLPGILHAVDAAPTSAATSEVAKGPEVGRAAADFHWSDPERDWRSLERSTRMAPYFSPKKFTRGCRNRLRTFRDDINALREAGADVCFIDLEDLRSHAQLAKMLAVPLRLPSCADKAEPKDHGVRNPRSCMGNASRPTPLIKPRGIRAKRSANIERKRNLGQVLVSFAVLKKSQA